MRFVWAIILGLVGPAGWTVSAAANGVVEINDSRAIAGGVTPGDGPGYPVIINEPGSYLLTSDLPVPDANTTAIFVASSFVSIDLNGFNIGGPTQCSGTADSLSCLPAGAGSGVLIGDVSHVSISNGAVFGMGGDGISKAGGQLSTDISVRKVRSADNGRGGIDLRAADDVTVVDSVASRNASVGIFIGTGEILRSFAEENGDAGLIGFRAGVTIKESTTIGNATDGIKLFDDGLALDNLIRNNMSAGMIFFTSAGGSKNNVLTGNGSDITGGTEIGLNVCDGAFCGAVAK